MVRRSGTGRHAAVQCRADAGSSDRPGRGRWSPEADLYRWGLIPAWAKDPGIGNKLINARSETVTEKPAFREAYKRRRYLVIVDGFFEWQKLAGGSKQPYYFKLKDDQPFAFTGLYEHWSLNEKSYQVCWGAMIASIYK